MRQVYQGILEHHEQTLTFSCFFFLENLHACKTQTYPLVSSRDIADNKKKVFKTTRLGLNRPNLSF